MTGELFASVLSIIISIALETVPGLAEFWEKWSWRRMSWLVGVFVIGFAIAGLAYAGAPIGVDIPGPFIWDGIVLVVRCAVAAYFLGQVTYAMQKVRRVDIG